MERSPLLQQLKRTHLWSVGKPRCKDVRTVCGADWPQTKYYVYFTDHQLRDRLPHNRVVAVMPSRLH